MYVTSMAQTQQQRPKPIRFLSSFLSKFLLQFSATIFSRANTILHQPNVHRLMQHPYQSYDHQLNGGLPFKCMKPFVIVTQVSKAESPMYVVVDKDSLGIVIEPLHSNIPYFYPDLF